MAEHNLKSRGCQIYISARLKGVLLAYDYEYTLKSPLLLLNQGGAGAQYGLHWAPPVASLYGYFIEQLGICNNPKDTPSFFKQH